MKDIALFVFVAIAVACLSMSGMFVNAESGKVAERPLASSTGVVLVDDCEVTGRLVTVGRGVYAIITAENRGSGTAEAEFNYVVNHLPKTSRMSRMGPIPMELKRGTCKFTFARGGTETKKVLIREEAQENKADQLAANLVAKASGGSKADNLLANPEVWTLVVSREQIKKGAGWGATAPATASGRIELKKGAVTLARTVSPAPRTT